MIGCWLLKLLCAFELPSYFDTLAYYSLERSAQRHRGEEEEQRDHTVLRRWAPI